VCHFFRCSPAKHPKRSDAILWGLAPVTFSQANELVWSFGIKISSALPTFLNKIKNVRLYHHKAEWSLVSRDLKYGLYSHIARDPLVDDAQVDT
jgi:hypothetical protein